MKQQLISAAILAGVLLSVIVIVGVFTDFLGARLIKKGSPRLAVHQGERVTLALANSPHTRKLEICTEQINKVLGYSDFSNCRALAYVVGPHVTRADVTIPSNFPLARAVVITRLRDAAGTLVPAAPTDEKIALWVTEARATKQPILQVESGGTDSGGGGDGPGGNGGPRRVDVSLEGLCIDPNDFEVSVTWKPNNTIISYRLAGEETWHYPYEFNGGMYTDSGDRRTTLLFNQNVEPPYATSYPLTPNTDFEFFFKPGQGHPNPDAEPSEIYRFNSGPAPEPDELFKANCDFRRLYP